MKILEMLYADRRSFGRSNRPEPPRAFTFTY